MKMAMLKSKHTNKLRITDKNSSGYVRITLYSKQRKQRFLLHRLVAETFIPNPHNYPEVNHINENKEDNSVLNLQWCTRIQNEHANRFSYGKIYKPFQVTFVNGEIKQYNFGIDLANELNVTRHCIYNYLKGKSTGYTKYNIVDINYLN